MTVRSATEMGAAPQFRADLETWVDRLLRPEWDVVLGADDTLGERASVRVCVANREATVIVCPTRDVRPDITACHEVVHIILWRLHDVATRMIAQLPESLRGYADATWAAAAEEVTEELARAFCRAYGESADG